MHTEKKNNALDLTDNVFFTFKENKTLLKEFYEEYTNTKKRETEYEEQLNKIKLRNCELENEIEKCKDVIKNMEKKKKEEWEHHSFEHDIQIKKLEKQIEALHRSLQELKEAVKNNEKELITLRFENNKLQIEQNKSFSISQQNKELENLVHHTEENQKDLHTVNEMQEQMECKMKQIAALLNQTNVYRQNVESQLKKYKNMCDSSIKKNIDLSLKYENTTKLYLDAQHKINVNKFKKKKLKMHIEELNQSINMLTKKNTTLKQMVRQIDQEKNEYFILFKKAETDNILFYHKLNKIANVKIPSVNWKLNRTLGKNKTFFHVNKTLGTPNIVELFFIKKERKKKKLMFYSDNEEDRKKKVKKKKKAEYINLIPGEDAELFFHK